MPRMKDTPYPGIHNDVDGGMTVSGRIIRDAWAFGLIPEDETCEGWLTQGLDDLWQRVNVEWEKYGFSVSQLPDDIKEKYLRIQKEALQRARDAGWDPDADLEDYDD